MQSRTGPMNERDLAAIIDEQINDAIIWEGDADKGTGQAGTRRKALQYFEGEATLGGDVPPQTNRSSVVSRDMSDVHGWVMPSLLRVFLGGDRVVIYEPRRREAEEGAKQATDYVNYIFLSECNGYSVLHASFWDGLTFGNGVIKHWWDDTPAYEVETLTGKSEKDYLDIVSDDNVEVLEHTERPDPAGDSAPAATSPGEGALMPADAPDAPPGGTGGPLGVAPPQMPYSGMGMPMMGAGSADQDVAGAMSALGAALPPPMLHDLKIKRKLYNGCLKIAAVPQEEFRIDRNATRLDEEHVRFCAHVDPGRTRSSLRIDFPEHRALIEELPAGTAGALDSAAIARDRSRGDVDTAPDHSTDLIEVWECYVQVDYDGDGVAEWRRVITAAGSTERHILANEEWGEDLPFTDIVPDPMPHRWRGGSLYEEVADIQRTKTVLKRGINDNLYWVLNPLRQAKRGSVRGGDRDKLLAPDFGDLIEMDNIGDVTELPAPFIADKLIAGIEFLNQEREFRTGVSAATMSLDPEALQNQTATAVNASQTASYSKIETYARNIAENGMKRLFKCILKLIIKHEDRERTIRLRGEFVTMDPRGWDADMDVIINVGLGSGSRDRDMGMMQVILQKMELISTGLGPVVAAKLGVGPDKYFHACRQLVEAAGIKSPESYFPEITEDQVNQLIEQMGSQQQQDPKAAESAAHVKLIEAQTQKVQAELQLRTQGDAAKSQMDVARTQMELQRGMYDLEHVKAQIENLRASALANMTKAGAAQSDAEINKMLSQLDVIDRAVSWNLQQQHLHHDAIDRLASIHQKQQEIDHGHEIAKMRERVRSPGVN